MLFVQLEQFENLLKVLQRERIGGGSVGMGAEFGNL